jgi:rSAM/selenodomain-associated transferase 1
MNTKEALILFVKYPEPGRVKTRLAKSIGDIQAASYYKEFLKRIAERLEGLRDRHEVLVYYTPPNKKSGIKKVIGSSFKFFPQTGSDLGERMQNAFVESFKRGFERVVIIGGDSPTLPPEYIERAFECLREGTTVVIGPARDGGYYLMGMKGLNILSPYSIFSNISWGTSDVLPATLDRLKRNNLSYRLLPQWYDIDTVEDLKLLD